MRDRAKWWSFWTLCALVLTALGVRLYHLTYHSLWFDEVVSTFWAMKPAGEIWRVGLTLTQDKHPPLYYLMLKGWTTLFGPGDYAVRSLGAVLGALAILPAYGIGRRLGGRRAGALGALLLALNPFLVWYSQEARMFMPATTFELVGLYGILQIANCKLQIANSVPRSSGHRRVLSLSKDSVLRSSGHRRVLSLSKDSVPRSSGHSIRYWLSVIGYPLLVVAGFTAALYTYLYSAFILPVAGAWLLWLWWLNRKRPGAARGFWLGVAALVVVGLLFLPLAYAAWSVSGREAVPGRAFTGMAPALWRLWQVYVSGWPHWPAQMSLGVAVGAGLLAVIGLLGPDLTHNPSPTRKGEIPPSLPGKGAGGLGFLWLVIPLLIGGFLLSRDSRVFAETRYQIALVPALCLIWGRGLAWLWTWRRPAGLVGLALALGVTLAALPADWSPENRREAWREAAAFVETHAGPHDAVLIQADYVHVAFERYFHGPQDVFFPFTDVLTDPAQVDPPLAGLADYDAVWVVQSHHQKLDPGNLVLGWFAARYPLITEVYPAGIALHGFEQHYRTPDLPPGVPRLDKALGDLRLLGCVYQPNALAARDDLLHPPSGWVHVTTYWGLDGAPPATDLFPVVRLVDASGQVWGQSLERGNDAIHIWSTSRWLPGEVVRADYDVNLNPITPPGAYRVVVEVPGLPESVGCGDVEITRLRK